MIKVCANPHCEEVAHNIDEKEKHCRSCGMRLLKINKQTYDLKFSNNWFQYDYQTGEFFRPQTNQLKLEFA